MKTFQPKLIMIDVDGTLVDSVPDLAYCIDEMKWSAAFFVLAGRSRPPKLSVMYV